MPADLYSSIIFLSRRSSVAEAVLRISTDGGPLVRGELCTKGFETGSMIRVGHQIGTVAISCVRKLARRPLISFGKSWLSASALSIWGSAFRTRPRGCQRCGKFAWGKRIHRPETR